MKQLSSVLKIRDYIKADFIKKGDQYYLVDISPNPTITIHSDFFRQWTDSLMVDNVDIVFSVNMLLKKLFLVTKSRIG